MLETLHKIGEQLLEGQGIWAQLTVEPKLNSRKTPYVCPILFDCINGEIEVQKDEIEIFKKDSSSVKFRYINTEVWGRRGKKCALTIEPRKFQMLEETLLGKDVNDPGSMMEAMIGHDPKLEECELYSALAEVNESLSEIRSELSLESINEQLDIGNDSEIVLFYSKIKSSNINGGIPTRLAELDGYEQFIIEKFGTANNSSSGLDYIKGVSSDEVIEATFSGRYNIHKVFQTTSSNYATGFTDFRKNFQSSPSTLAALDKASEYVLNHLQTRIAGISHIIIPSLLHKSLDALDLEDLELYLNTSSELLFETHELDGSIQRTLSYDHEVFWINYIGFESDGNSFKVINHIKDVNNRYLEKLHSVFVKTTNEFEHLIGGKYPFNLQSVYFLIPTRKSDKSKLNEALVLFSEILQQRSIKPEFLFHHAIKLILCHWFERYAAYQNIRPTKSFDYAVKDVVFKYSALFYALKKLNLISMTRETEHTTHAEGTSENEFQNRIEGFFRKMQYTNSEKAMFYLGRVLSQVGIAQYKKGHESKPVLKKVNFNGMDTDSVMRFSLDLAEKARQYDIHNSTEKNFSEFRNNFNHKDWSLSKEENVFYLMVGYSFGLTSSTNQ